MSDPLFQIRKIEVVNLLALQPVESAAILDGINPHYPYRRIFAYFEPKITPAAGDYSIQAGVRMYLDNVQVGEELPYDICYDTNGRVQKSAFSVFGNSQTGGSAPGLLGIASTFSVNSSGQPNRVMAIPFFPIQANINKLQFSINGVADLVGSGSTFSGFRIFMACISTSAPY